MYRQLWTTIMAGHEWVGDLHNRRRTGETFWERVRIAPVTDEHGAIAHLVAMKEDITEHRKLEDQLRRAQRVEAIGTLASGIAHDMNNILAPILLTPMLLRQQLSGACEQELAIIEQSAQRAADLVRQLLVFSRGSAGDRVPLRMQRLIQEMRSIVTETFPREITLRVDVGPNLLPVLGDSTQLHQVLLNLCVNARDAMPKGGLLTIAAENTVVDASQARLHPPAKAGPHVVVRVSDTGFGMSHEVLERVFDPFFTTKPEGQGTGIGLSTVLGIVRGHQGFITVSSVMDKGSTFCVYLPVAEAEAGNAIGPVSALAQARGELILVVDDEPLVRASSEQVLRQHGYRVVTAADGTEALAAYQLHAAEIALVLTDVMMPIMNGVDLVRALRERQPTLKIVIATGMASDANIHDLTGLGVTGILAKPNSARELLETVSRALGTSSTPGVPAGSA
jgi:signal transduction histidine kinase/ActR/RegA family two-component response regulator